MSIMDKLGQNKEADMQAQLEAMLPAKRTYRVVVWGAKMESPDVFILQHHSYTPEDSGALSFVDYVIWQGQVLPLKVHTYCSYVEVEDVTPAPVGLVGIPH